MRLHSKLDSSAANGPGNRAVIWFQGCTLACPGCHNPETHSFDVKQTPIEEVEAWLSSLRGIEGVTFSGGEPMQHFDDLLRLCRYIREHHPLLSIGMFTGYSLKELRTTYAVEWWKVSYLLDFAVCGRFNIQQATSEQPLCGSRNQVLEILSERYMQEDFTQQIAEVTISEDLVVISGFPGVAFIEMVKEN